MKLSEFSPIFEKLKGKWPRYFTADMESDIYLLLEAVDVERFEKFVKNVMWRKVGDPPGLEVFHSFKKYQKGDHKRDRTTEEIREDADCPVCFDVGIVHTRDSQPPLFKDGYGESMFFRCPCPEGKFEKEVISIYNDGWAERYKLIRNPDSHSRKTHDFKYMTIDGNRPYPRLKINLDEIMKAEGA